MADDAKSFAEAVEAELHGWDAAIERLQARAATKVQDARDQAEAAIAELRRTRNRAAERSNALRAAVVEIVQRSLFARVATDVTHRLLRVRADAFDHYHGPELVNRFFDVVTVQKSA